MTKHKIAKSTSATSASLGQFAAREQYVPSQTLSSRTDGKFAGSALSVRGTYSTDESGRTQVQASANLKFVDRKLGVRELNNRIAGRVSSGSSTK